MQWPSWTGGAAFTVGILGIIPTKNSQPDGKEFFSSTYDKRYTFIHLFIFIFTFACAVCQVSKQPVFCSAVPYLPVHQVQREWLSVNKGDSADMYSQWG
jgi:hypothetical protein